MLTRGEYFRDSIAVGLTHSEYNMLSQPSVNFRFGLNEFFNFMFNSSPWIYLPGTSSVNPCRLLGFKALCSKNKIFTIQLYSVWRITSGSNAVLVNYAVGGWEYFCVSIEKYISPLTVSWFLENYHFFHMDGSMPGMSLPLSFPVSMHNKKGSGWIDSCCGCPPGLSCFMHEFLL